MPDIETTIGNLEQNIRWIEEIECHQFPGWANVTMAMRDAAELLKESRQESVIPHQNYQYLSDYWCKCGWHLGKRGAVNYCPECGRKVKWDD